MQSKAKTVSAYLDEVPADRKPALKRLRAICKAKFPEAEETMMYGMPVYRRGEDLQIAFASQKDSINLYATKATVLKQFLPRLKGVSTGKGCIRFPKPEKMDFELIEEIISATAESREKSCES